MNEENIDFEIPAGEVLRMVAQYGSTVTSSYNKITQIRTMG